MKKVIHLRWSSEHQKGVLLSKDSSFFRIALYQMGHKYSPLLRIVMTERVAQSLAGTWLFSKIIVPVLFGGLKHVANTVMHSKSVSVFTVEDDQDTLYLVCEKIVIRIIMDQDVLGLPA